MHVDERDRGLKRAELLSSVGAGVLGAGIALLVPQVLAPFGLWLLAIGLVAHGTGMAIKHRLERGLRRAGAWDEWLFWGCWAALFGLAIVLALRMWPTDLG